MLDTAFGVSGIAALGPGSSVPPLFMNQITGSVVAPNGDIVAIGSALGTLVDNDTSNVAVPAVARFTPTGSLDTSFGVNGVVPFLSLGGQSPGLGFSLSNLAVQPDGKVLLRADSFDTAGHPDLIIRLNADGTYDQSFATGGEFTLPKTHAGEPGLALQADGNILVSVDGAFGAGNTDVVLERLTGTGAVDTSFGTNGEVTTTIPQANDAESHTLLIAQDGTVYLQGLYFTTTLTEGTFVVHLLPNTTNTNLTLDPSFGNGTGIALVPDSTVAGANFSGQMALSAGGKVVLEGTASPDQPPSPAAVMRLNTDGTLDATFGNGAGFVIAGNSDPSGGLAVQADGRIVVGTSFSTSGGVPIPGVERLNRDGTPDTSFGTQGNGFVPSPSAGSLSILGNDIVLTSTIVIMNTGAVVGSDMRAFVAGPIAPPNATAVTTAGTAVTIDPLANDHVDAAGALTISSVTQGTNGSVALVSGKPMFTPNVGFTGIGSFTYTAQDASGDTATADVFVTVVANASTPLVNNDGADALPGTATTLDVLANDGTSPPGGSLTIVRFTQPADGNVSESAGKLIYTSNSNFTGTDTFTYTAQDSQGNSATAAVLVEVGAPVATLIPSTALLNLGTVAAGSAGTPQTYTISGSDLTANVVITGPPNVELSTDGSNYQSSLTLTPTMGTLAQTSIDVRISAAATIGIISAPISNSSTGAAQQFLTLRGTVSQAPPVLAVSATSLNLGTAVSGTPGTPQTYTIGGSNLTANVVLAAPLGVELSTDGTNYQSSLTLTPNMGALAQTTIDVRISAAAAVGSIGGAIMDSSSGAMEQDVSVSGTVAEAPTVQFSAATETVDASAGTFNVPVTLTGTVTPTVNRFASGFVVPDGLAFDAAGNLYVSNNGNNTVSKVTPAGVVSTFASGFNGPTGLAFDVAGNLYVANVNGNTVSKVTPAGTVSTFASGFVGPSGLAFDAAGNLYVANFNSSNGINLESASVSVVTPAGAVRTFATGFSEPTGLVFDAAGNLYVANRGLGTVSKVTPTGVVSTFATVGQGYSLAIDAAGNLYVAVNSGGTVSKVTPVGMVSTFASGFNSPLTLTFDAAGSLYVGNGGTVSKVTSFVNIPFTLGGTALAGTDYSGVTASPLLIPAGETTGAITGTLLSDPGLNKTLTITLGAPSGASLGGATTNTLTINQPSPMTPPSIPAKAAGSMVSLIALPSKSPLVFRGGAFSFAGTSAISIADNDSGNLNVQATLGVTRGTLLLSGGGLTVTGNGTAQLVVSGSTAAITAALGRLVYQAPTSFVGMALLTVSTNDGSKISAQSTRISIIDPTPVVDPSAAQTGTVFVAKPGKTFSGSLAKLFTSTRGDHVTIRLVGKPPPGGKLSLKPSGVFTFKPSKAFIGTTRFQVAAFDGFSMTKPVTVTLANVAPRVVPPSLALSVPSMVKASGGVASLRQAKIASTNLNQTASFVVSATAGGFKETSTGVKTTARPGMLTLSGPIERVNTVLSTLSLVLVNQHEVVSAEMHVTALGVTKSDSVTIEF